MVVNPVTISAEAKLSDLIALKKNLIFLVFLL